MQGLLYLCFCCNILRPFHRLGDAYNESYIQLRTDRQVNFCNKLFAAWDFNITDVKTAKLRRAHIRTDFQVRKKSLVALPRC